jgi:Acetyltransferase (GNAT) domain
MRAASEVIESQRSPRLADYSPLALHPDWVLERYYGWSTVWQDDGSKVVRRRWGPAVRHLVLTNGLDADGLEHLARRCRVFHPLGIVSLNDFAATVDEPSRSLAGRSLRLVVGPRWFGVGTFVHALAQDESILWRCIAPRERTKCTSAIRSGVRVEIHDRPNDDDLSDLFSLYDRMARERGLEEAPLQALRAMSRDGRLIHARSVDVNGRTLVANAIHCAHGQGYFLLGARAENVAPGAGHLLHWEVMRKLKADGCRFYDLGLVASRGADDGIFRFKRSLGGTFVSSGAEFEWMSPFLLPLRKMFARRSASPHANR